MKLPKYLTTVTPLSKGIALGMFVVLPFLGFYIGMAYQQRADEDQSDLPVVESVTVPSAYPLPTANVPSCCTPTQETDGYECIQQCGPPLMKTGDNYPKYTCMSPQELKSLSPAEQHAHRRFACPVCLSSATKIATPQGNILVTALRPGTQVFTIDRKGNTIIAPILKVSNTEVPSDHKVVDLRLSDGREVFVSPNHPLISGLPVGDLKVGDKYSGAVVVGINRVPYTDTKTYDILPAGDTGVYFANGILLKSTLK